MDKTLGTELAELAKARWAEDAAPPHEAVLEKLRHAARKGYSWKILGLDELDARNLHWLGLQGLGLQKLSPMEGRPDKPGGWRVTWVQLPKGVEHAE